MPVFRVKKDKNFKAMSNYHLRDKELSLKAKGLLSLMLSLPEEWDYSLKGLACICKEGVYVIRNAVNELERQGYVKRQRVRNEKSQMTDTEYHIYEKPVSDLPTSEKPTLDNPMLEKPILENPTLENCTQINIDINK